MQEYALARTPEEAATLIADDPATIVMGGGTTLVPRATMGELRGSRVVGLARAGLDYVHRNGATKLGAMTPLSTVASLDEVPALAAAASAVGSWALRSTATIGGNLLVAGPYGDLVPVLLALDAQVETVGAAGRRTAALDEALRSGSVAEPGEVVAEVVVPPDDGTCAFRRCARLAAGSPPVVTVAARVRREGGSVAEARVALGAVAPHALRATAAEERLVGSPGDATAIGEAAAAAAGVVEPVDDSVASAWYRRRMTELYVRRALEAALGEKE